MSESTRTIPHFFLSVEADMTGTLQLRDRLLGEVGKKAGVRLSITDILVKITALALRDHPIINSRIEGEGIRLVEEVNIGVAMAVEDGLIVPVIHGADRKSITEIASALRDLTEKARSNTLSVGEVTAGTFTLSNLGMFGIDTFNAIINPPQCSILGVGRTVEKPVAEGGRVGIKPMAWLTLSADHRIVDGATAAKFLGRVKELLENPNFPCS
jgi:pyruvate dehydrogenase E2 component (dihydrolipoamide acetyltransferase)